MKTTSDPVFDKLRASVFETQGDMPYKRSYDVISDYQNNVINGYHRNLMKVKAQAELDLMMKNNKDYKPSEHEKKVFSIFVFKPRKNIIRINGSTYSWYNKYGKP